MEKDEEKSCLQKSNISNQEHYSVVYLILFFLSLSVPSLKKKMRPLNHFDLGPFVELIWGKSGSRWCLYLAFFFFWTTLFCSINLYCPHACPHAIGEDHPLRWNAPPSWIWSHFRGLLPPNPKLPLPSLISSSFY